MGDASSITNTRALLLHGSSAEWRQAMRFVLRAVADADVAARRVTMLFSSREAEAAKCLADPRLVLVVALDEPAIRRTLSTLAPSLPVVWTTESDDANQVAARVRAQLDE